MGEKKKEENMRFFWEEPPEKTTSSEFSFRIPKALEIKKMPINVTETDKDIIIRADVPGFKKNEISLNVTENFMEIIAQKKEEKMERTEKMFRHERSSGSLRRAFTLPQLVDAERAEAKMENNMLIISIPKLYAVKRRKKKVEIK